MVTSLGRTGTTWLMQLLSEHPQVVVYRDYPYELRVAKYWMHMLKVVSEPANHFQSADPENFHSNMWYIGHNPFYSGSVADHPQLGRWFGRIHVEQLATFCQFSIEECYKQVADSQRQLEPVYFAEKHVPDRIPGLIWELYAQAREVILVRDFRDMVCSMLAYNAKRGYNSFGREEVSSDEEFILRVYQTHLVPLVRSWKSRSKQAHLLRYEDLILHPARTLSFLLEYLDLDHSSSTVEGMIQRASKERPGMEQHRTSPDLERSIGRWRRDLNPSLQAVCQETFRDILEEFGYTE
jgi:hypothetical protein